MKKFLLFAALFCCVNAFAQDVILKRDGSDIKAKVLEITDQQVKYKDYDFQSGPTRNINISDVFMITYENGQKEVFNQQSSASTNQGGNYSTPQSDLQKEFYRIGTDDDEMLNFFKKNNFTGYYEDFQSACRMRSTGKGLLGAGIGLSVGGLVLTTTGFVLFAYNYNYKTGLCLYYSGLAVMGAGEVLVIVSIPISAVAGGKKASIKNDFARQQFGVNAYYQPRLNFGLTNNGVGLTLNF